MSRYKVIACVGLNCRKVLDTTNILTATLKYEQLEDRNYDDFYIETTVGKKKVVIRPGLGGRSVETQPS